MMFKEDCCEWTAGAPRTMIFSTYVASKNRPTNPEVCREFKIKSIMHSSITARGNTHLRCLSIQLGRLNFVQHVHSSRTLKDPFALELLLVLVAREGDTIERDALDILRDEAVKRIVKVVCGRSGDERSQTLLCPGVQLRKDDSGGHGLLRIQVGSLFVRLSRMREGYKRGFYMF